MFTENGVSMFLWIGHNVDPELIQQLFGVASAAQVDIDKVGFHLRVCLSHLDRCDDETLSVSHVLQQV